MARKRIMVREILLKVDNELYERLSRHKEETGVPMNETIRRILRQHFEEIDRKGGKR